METLEQIFLMKESIEDDLLQLPGVTAVDVGYKSVGGEQTDRLSIVVFVKHKTAVVEPAHLIPRTINGVPTDVLEGEFALDDSMHKQEESMAEVGIDPNRYDPLLGGISIGNPLIGSGTLGAIVQDRNNATLYILSCYHVMFNTFQNPGGALILQPSGQDGGVSPRDIVGVWQVGLLGGRFDCAIARLGNQRLGTRQSIVGIGAIAGVNAAPRLTDILQKRGRTTLLTDGQVGGLNWSGYLTATDSQGNTRKYIMRNQLRINRRANRPPVAGRGDSGALWLDANNMVVGLHCASSLNGDLGIANYITPVLIVLGITF